MHAPLPPTLCQQASSLCSMHLAHMGTYCLLLGFGLYCLCDIFVCVAPCKLWPKLSSSLVTALGLAFFPNVHLVFLG